MFQVRLSMNGAGVHIVKALRELSNYRLDEAKAAIKAGNPVVISEFENKADAFEARDVAACRHPFVDFWVDEAGEDTPLVEDNEETLPRICDADLLAPDPPPYDDDPPF